MTYRVHVGRGLLMSMAPADLDIRIESVEDGTLLVRAESAEEAVRRTVADPRLGLLLLNTVPYDYEPWEEPDDGQVWLDVAPVDAPLQEETYIASAEDGSLRRA